MEPGTPYSATESPLVDFDAVCQKVRTALEPARAHAVSLHDENGDLLWLTESSMGPDEHNAVLEALETFRAPNGQAVLAYDLGDARSAMLLRAVNARRALVGAIMVVMDSRAIKQDDRGVVSMMTPKLQRALADFAIMRPDVAPEPTAAKPPVPEPAKRPAAVASAQPAALMSVKANAGRAAPAARSSAAAPGAALSSVKMHPVRPSSSARPAARPTTVVPPRPASAPSARPAASSAPAPRPASAAAPPVRQAPSAEARPAARPSVPASAPRNPGASIAANAREHQAPKPDSSDDVFELSLMATGAIPARQPATTAPAEHTLDFDIDLELALETELDSEPELEAPEAPAPRSPAHSSAPAQAPAPPPPAASAPSRAPAAAPAPAAAKASRAPAPTPAPPPAQRPTERRPAEPVPAAIDRLNAALRSSPIALHVQRLVPLAKGSQLQRYEVLLRSKSDLAPNSAPQAMLKAAVENGLGSMIDRRVVSELIAWLVRHPEVWQNSAVMFSVNLTATALHDEHFMKFVGLCLAKASLPTAMIAFEVDVAIATKLSVQTSEVAVALHRMGCPLVLDDFAMRTECFELLRLPGVRYLKISPEITAKMRTDKHSQAAITAVVQMARVLGMHTVAKRTETTAEQEWLTALGVDFVQSHSLSPPASIESLGKSGGATTS